MQQSWSQCLVPVCQPQREAPVQSGFQNAPTLCPWELEFVPCPLDSAGTGTAWPTGCRGSNIWAVQGQVFGRPGPWSPEAPTKEQPCEEALENERPREERPRQGATLLVWPQPLLSPRDNYNERPQWDRGSPGWPTESWDPIKGCRFKPPRLGMFCYTALEHYLTYVPLFIITVR